jgi:tellurite methyltransferase
MPDPPPSSSAESRRSWSEEDTRRFVAATSHRPPRPLLLEALPLLGESPPGRLAVDLGCGSGTESLELLRRGWRVVATDAFPAAIESLEHRVGEGRERLEARLASFESIAAQGLPIERGGASLVHAGFSLPFCPPDRFGPLWQEILRWLRPGAFFVGQFFGAREPIVLEAPPRTATAHDEPELRRLLQGFELRRFEEVDRPGENAYGEAKHWHLFHVIASRRA